MTAAKLDNRTLIAMRRAAQLYSTPEGWDVNTPPLARLYGSDGSFAILGPVMSDLDTCFALVSVGGQRPALSHFSLRSLSRLNLTRLDRCFLPSPRWPLRKLAEISQRSFDHRVRECRTQFPLTAA